MFSLRFFMTLVGKQLNAGYRGSLTKDRVSVVSRLGRLPTSDDSADGDLVESFYADWTGQHTTAAAAAAAAAAADAADAAAAAATDDGRRQGRQVVLQLSTMTQAGNM